MGYRKKFREFYAKDTTDSLRQRIAKIDRTCSVLKAWENAQKEKRNGSYDGCIFLYTGHLDSEREGILYELENRSDIGEIRRIS